MISAIIKLGYACNNDCIFCHAKAKKHYPDLSTNQAKEKIDIAKSLPIRRIIFSGGEPTIRKDLFEIAGYAISRGLRLGLITNARMLSYPLFLEKLSGLDYAYISLHGPEKIHNHITNDDTFAQTIGGIRNTSSRGIRTIVNCVVSKKNIEYLKEVVDIMPCQSIKLKFSLVETTRENFGLLGPDLDYAAQKIKDAIGYAGSKGLKAGFDGMPLCLMQGYELDNLMTNDISYISECYDDDFFPSDQGNRIRGPGCKGCKIEACEGYYGSYLPSATNLNK